MLEPTKVFEVYGDKLGIHAFTAGEIIFDIGQPGELVYGIIEGEVELQLHGKSVEIIGAGDLFGEGALVHPEGLRGSTALAKTDCKLTTMNRSHFLFAVQETPMFALEVIRSYSDRLLKLKHQLAESSV
ncbi:cyclic nucleotide-binding protein [Neosynechococcus sphagnicola sy1]|uniref:Cyclic nucleotide-binding protein n=1 Tax=Neosynechococcus sphagnicola sy1 TaxID=1497020 RepID=A0A098TNZ8_9CYAN|nr:Crp/Fnr family transcriptional regulator [Neosynechococcus sphagnicola]KGF74024.1 cyclic nucleotide-binding protein [Neosynechococcus sphagnicola sy1]